MNYQLAKTTASQNLRMLSQYKDCSAANAMSSEEIIDKIKKAQATDKNGRYLAENLEDMAGRKESILILNLASDDLANIDEYLVLNHSKRLALGLEILAKAGNCTEVLIYTTKALSVDDLSEKIDVKNKIVEGEGSLVLREDTALYSSITDGIIRSNNDGHSFMSKFKSEGLDSRPTLVVDSETACNVACIFENPEAPLTKIMLVDSKEQVLTEVAIGTDLDKIISELEITIEKPVLLGGRLGRFIPKDDIKLQKISFDRKFDSLLLSTQDDCIAQVCANMMKETREQSCQKCVMCREGSFQFNSMLSSVVEGKAKRENIAIIEDIAPIIAISTLCNFGKNMAEFAISAVECNRSEIEAHIVKKTCPAKQCSCFMSYVIDPKLCDGCEECVDECEYDAIEGKKKFIHMIDPKMCEKCGTCAKVCPNDAISTNSDTIRIPRKLTRVGRFK